jgi:hypothetical protein
MENRNLKNPYVTLAYRAQEISIAQAEQIAKMIRSSHVSFTSPTLMSSGDCLIDCGKQLLDQVGEPRSVATNFSGYAEWWI